ncbi:V-type ATP synthase subunit C [bioreactor metagenome]|uniref:V-type ATP synthase subunit C n=1 Tax=bioreactor metagenome TaxID=1076179 RepID=A0A645ABB9_9ZZZZ
MSYSANAIYTKAKAMYGRRLTYENYVDMINCPHVADVASYLSTSTQYSEVFSDIQVASISRVLLENSLRKHLFNQFASICNYQRAIGQELYKYFIILSEIEQILSCIRFLKTERKDDYLFSMPAFMNNHTSIDLFKLARTENISDVIMALQGTDYEEKISRYVVDDNPNLLMIEAVLYRYLFRETQKLAQKSLKGKERKEFLEIVHIRFDMSLISNLYRLKKYFRVSPDRIFDYIKVTFHVTNFTEKQINAMIYSNSVDELFAILESTVYGKSLKFDQFDSIEQCTRHYEYEWASKKMIFSVYPSVVMFCGILLAQNEINNIIHIEEGIKYHIPKEDIMNALIGFHEKKEGENVWQ